MVIPAQAGIYATCHSDIDLVSSIITYMSVLVEKAKNLALKAHEGQTYGSDNRPYEWHIGKTAELAERMGYPEEVVAGCWLHDVAEDTEVTIEDLRKEFPSATVDGVAAVTYIKGVDQEDKIEKAKKHVVGHVIKLCDASVNFSASVLDGPRVGHEQYEVIVKRYGRYISELLLDLPTPEEVVEYIEDLSDTINV